MKISKIAMFTILMLNGTAKSQEFYTCIPNDDWVKGKAKEEITDTHIQNIVKQTILKSKWTLVRKLTPYSNQWEFQQTLPAGRYRVTAAGAGGGEQVREFTLTYSQEYKACAGQAGRNSENNNGGAGGGGMGYDGIYCGGGGGDGVFDGDDNGDGGGGSFCLYRFVDNGGWGKTRNYDGIQSELNGIKAFYGGGGGDSSGDCGFDGGKGSGNNGGKGGKGWCGDKKETVAGAGGGGGGYLGEGGGGGNLSNDAGCGVGGKGCYGGGGGAGGISVYVSGGGGGGGGSYFQIANIELKLKGGDGLKGGLLDTNGGKGAGPDGYVIIEKWE